MTRNTWIIVLVAAGVGLAVLIGLLGDRGGESQAQAQQSFCSSLSGLESSVVADIYAILSSGYKAAALAGSQSTGKYVNVDPEKFEGTWSGKYADNSPFKLSVANVRGFKATVKYQSRETVQYQDVLIKNDSFRIGDTKFTLQKNGAGANAINIRTQPSAHSSTIWYAKVAATAE